MKVIRTMVNGMPGAMASLVVEHALEKRIFGVAPISLTGPEIEETDSFVIPKSNEIASQHINYISPSDAERKISEYKIQSCRDRMIYAVDYTTATAALGNVELYCKLEMPFVIGTTSYDYSEARKMVGKSQICAVIAPNMSKQIVVFMAMMKHLAETFPGSFQDFILEIWESHQASKEKTSGTAEAMVEIFNALGILFTKDQIKVIRGEIASRLFGVPEEHLDGHGFHTYRLISPDGNVCFEFKHNVCGRDTYALGTLDALVFLHKKMDQGCKGQVFDMIDVAKGL